MHCKLQLLIALICAALLLPSAGCAPAATVETRMALEELILSSYSTNTTQAKFVQVDVGSEDRLLYLVYAQAEGFDENALVFSIVSAEQKKGNYIITAQSNLYSDGAVFEYKTKDDRVMNISIVNSQSQSIDPTTDTAMEGEYYYRCSFT